MQVIPTINCLHLACITEKIKKAAEFLPLGGWVQIDIADGKFTEYRTWNNPEELQELRIKNNELGILSIEVHLMIENPEQAVEGWVRAGAKRIIVHIEAINNLELITNNLKTCKLGLAVGPETPAEKLVPYLRMGIKFIQVLAVSPGKSGQKFDERVLDKIKFLKQNHSDVIIEVDGGINLETAKLCKDARADILTAGSYIWEDNNPGEAYKRLAAI